MVFRWATELFLLLLVAINCFGIEFRRYDGWYNNLNCPEFGAVRQRQIYLAAPQYSDGIQQFAGTDRPGPGLVSDKLLKGPDGLPAFRNLSALFAFFGQVVSSELISTVSAESLACPPEAAHFQIGNFGDCDKNFSTCSNQSLRFAQFFRLEFDKNSGWSINHPRTPINQITSWIDGNFVYGMNQPWADSLRKFEDGLLRIDASGYPLRNRPKVPLINPNPPAYHPHVFSSERLYLLGNFESNQNPPLLALSILFHRWHNVVSGQLLQQPAYATASDEDLFQRARQLVTAHLQKIIMYDYVPVLLGEDLPKYTGYNANVNPAISAEFQAAAFRFGQTLIPSGHYATDHKCRHKAISLCQFWWDASTAFRLFDVEEVLRGLTLQRAESEDHIFAYALQQRVFGPLTMNFGDLVALSIQRGRDVGIADYNSVRKAVGLSPIQTFFDINPKLFKQNEKLLEDFTALYHNDMNNIDLFVGGMLETADGRPGPVFREILKSQFLRVRGGDRFWFENTANGLFSAAEIEAIKSISLKSIIVQTSSIVDSDIQDNVFEYNPSGNKCGPQPAQLNITVLGSCPEPQGYDFFSGSEVSFVSTFAVLFSVPFACCLVGLIISLLKKKQLLQRASAIPQSLYVKNTTSVSEYLGRSGKRLNMRCIQLLFGIDGSLIVLNKEGKVDRTIQFSALRIQSITVRVSSDSVSKHRVLLVRLREDYDLVLLLSSEDELCDVKHQLLKFIEQCGKEVQESNASAAGLLDEAVTLAKRQRTLENFFETAFDQVLKAKMKTTGVRFSKRFSLSDKPLAAKAKKLMAVELTKKEFASAMQLKPDSLFVNQMFSVADTDRNGYISYAEFIDLLALMSKGSLSNKMRMLFHMYDLDENGLLDLSEFTVMIKSLLDMSNNRALQKQELDAVVDGMIRECGLDTKSVLGFDEFYQIIQKNQGQICNHFKFTESDCRTEDDVEGLLPVAKHDSSLIPSSRFDRYVVYISRYLENKWNDLLWLTLYILLSCGLFAQTFTSYYFFKEEKGFRKILGYSAALSRGSAAALSFTFGVLLLTACRNIMTMLRDTVLAYYVPFDSAIKFHRFLACMILLFSVIHVIGHAINFYELSTQPPFVINCVFPEFYIDSNQLPKFHDWAFKTVPGVTGILLVVCLSHIFIFATATFRNRIFGAFRITHRLFPVVYCLLFVHSSYRMLQATTCHVYILGPLILYIFDWLISLRSKCIPVKIVKVESLPSNVLHLCLKTPKGFCIQSGQWIRVAVCSLGDGEFHPFTNTSAPHEKTISVYIRSVGPWTRRAYSLFSECLQNKTPIPKILLDGPYGSTHQNWYKYGAVVLVGGGIGVTPHAAVLKDLVYKVYQQESNIATKQVHFIWIARNHQQFEWFIDILREVERQDCRHLVRIDIFITQFLKDFDIRTMMLYVCEDHFQRLSSKSLFTGLRAQTHFGRINFVQYLLQVKQTSNETKKIGVFSCGPKSLVHSLESACRNINKAGISPCLIPYHEIF